jgi:hypothetical protein
MSVDAAQVSILLVANNRPAASDSHWMVKKRRPH